MTTNEMNVKLEDVEVKSIEEIQEYLRTHPKRTKAEVRSQRISFVMADLPDDSDLTREDVARMLDEMEGVDEDSEG